METTPAIICYSLGALIVFLGLFERIFIATLVVLMIVGITTLVGQPVTGSIFGLFIWSYFVAVGFIPIWAILIPIFGGVLLASKS